jgi:hypothetical protein
VELHRILDLKHLVWRRGDARAKFPAWRISVGSALVLNHPESLGLDQFPYAVCSVKQCEDSVRRVIACWAHVCFMREADRGPAFPLEQIWH